MITARDHNDYNIKWVSFEIFAKIKFFPYIYYIFYLFKLYLCSCVCIVFFCMLSLTYHGFQTNVPSVNCYLICPLIRLFAAHRSSSSPVCIECHHVIKLLKCLPPNHLFGRPGKIMNNKRWHQTANPKLSHISYVLSNVHYIM